MKIVCKVTTITKLVVLFRYVNNILNTSINNYVIYVKNFGYFKHDYILNCFEKV